MATRKQSEALAEKRALADELRGWRESVIRKLEKARAKRAKVKPSSRGVDRVPTHLRGLSVTTKVVVSGTTHHNPAKDRSLPGKARRVGRKAARRRTYFFRGHGLAGANDFNLRYECHAPGCGFGIISPLDDFDFMTDVMDHEGAHSDEVGVSA